MECFCYYFYFHLFAGLCRRIFISFFLLFLVRILCGLTQFTTKGHIIRASLEAVCFQTRDILEAMNKDYGIPLTKLLVDGKMAQNNLLMQLQADLAGIPVGKMLISYM